MSELESMSEQELDQKESDIRYRAKVAYRKQQQAFVERAMVEREMRALAAERHKRRQQDA